MRYKMYFSMSDIHSKNIYLKSLSIAKGVYSDNFNCIIPKPYNHFIKINEIIYFVPSTNDFMYKLHHHLPLSSIVYASPDSAIIALNEFTAEIIFSYFENKEKHPKDSNEESLKHPKDSNEESLKHPKDSNEETLKDPQKEKKEYLKKLKKESPMIEIIDYPSQKCIYDLRGNHIRFTENKFVLSNIKNDEIVHHTEKTPRKDIIDGYLYNYIADSFVMGDYKLSDKMINLLRKITDNNQRSLKALAMLTAAAYTCDQSLKTAILFVAKNTSDVTTFLNKLFNNNLAVLNSANVKTPKDLFSAYTNFLFASGGAYIVNDEQPLNFDIIRKMIKSAYFTIEDDAVGEIRFKNKTPLIVLTQSKEYAEKFKNQVKSYIINADDELQTVNDISDYEFMQLRQALALYGLKLFTLPQKDEKLTSTDAPRDSDIIKKFIKLFCRNKKNAFVPKSEIKEAFKRYTDEYYPYFKSSPISICNHYRDLGFDTIHKKRINKDDNPVGVITGVEFNSEKFNEYISNTDNIPKNHILKNDFDITFDELLSSTISLTRKTFYV